MAIEGWQAAAKKGRSSAMALRDGLSKRASRLAADAQRSLRRGRLEAERRLVQRQHRGALGRLGEHAYALVRAGTLPAGELGPELGALEDTLRQIDENRRQTEALRPAEEGATASEDTTAASAGPGWEAAERFFRRGS
jgi:hypothetical protein